MKSIRRWGAAVLAASALGCGEESNGGEEAAVATASPSVMIVSPTDGADLDGGPVVVRLAAMGVDVVPAGVEQANSGHHHLFINRDPTPVGETIPAGEGIVHLGAAQTEYEFTDLAPGEYTVTAVLGDHLHVRIAEIEPHRVTFTVR